MKKKYCLALFAAVPPTLFLSYPFFKTDWALICISAISVTFVGMYVLKNNFRQIMESIGGNNLFLSFLDLVLMMSALMISYAMTLLFLIEVSLKLRVSMTIVFIFHALIGIFLLKSLFKMTRNFIK